MANVKFDLLGDPIPANHGQVGRNEHAPNAETSNKIRVLLCSGMNLREIAREVGLSVPTLRKHYFQNGAVSKAAARKVALSDQRAKVLLRLDAAADGGNVTAMKAQLAILDSQIAKVAAGEEEDRRAKGPGAPAPKGKKAASVDAAHEAEADFDDWLEEETGNLH